MRDRLDGIRADLLGIPDIGKVQLLGVQEEQISIDFSPQRLAALNLPLQQVADAIASQNDVVPTGLLRSSKDRISLRVSGALDSEQGLRDIQLRINGRSILLSDIAAISRHPADPAQPLFRVNGQKAMGIAISMAASGNLTVFGAAVKDKMAEIARTLPHGIEMTMVADQTGVVSDAIWGFMKVLLEAIAIVLAVSFLSLGMRAGLVVAVSIPLVLALTFVGMDLAGIGLQRISLGALIIALGLLVDDAMITVEAMVSKLEEGWPVNRAASFAYESTAFPMLTGTLVMVAGFIPVGFAASSAGEYCYSLFMVVMISLLASWMVAVLFSPLLGVWILPKSMAAHSHQEGRFMRMYGNILNLCLLNRIKTVIIALLAFAISAVGATKLEAQFFPTSDRPELLVSLSLSQNASFEATDAASKRLEAVLAKDPAVDRFSTYVGSGAIRFYLPMDVLLSNDNITQTVVVAKSLEERDELRGRLEAAFRTDFGDIVARATPLELGPPVGWPLKLRVTGPDPTKVRSIAEEVAGIVAENPATRDVNLTSGEPQRKVLVTLRQSEARAVGLTSRDVAAATAMIFSGSVVTAVRDNDRLIEVVLRANASERYDLDTLSNLQILTSAGLVVPLSQVATLSYGVEDPIIWRRQRLPIVTVQADVSSDMQPATVVAQLHPALEKFSAGLPSGYRVEVGGATEEAAKGNDSVMAVMPAMLLVMFSLLMIQLRSFTRSFIAVVMAPFGLIGVVLAMLPTGTPMGFVAQLGVIALAGMIIRNAVILIEEVDQNTAKGEAPETAVVHAAKHRARPIVLTACAAILGMLPIAPQVFWGPMAFAIIGGLTAATILTLTVLPCILVMLLHHEAKQSNRPFDDLSHEKEVAHAV